MKAGDHATRPGPFGPGLPPLAVAPSVISPRGGDRVATRLLRVICDNNDVVPGGGRGRRWRGMWGAEAPPAPHLAIDPTCSVDRSSSFSVGRRPTQLTRAATSGC